MNEEKESVSKKNRKTKYVLQRQLNRRSYANITFDELLTICKENNINLKPDAINELQKITSNRGLKLTIPNREKAFVYILVNFSDDKHKRTDNPLYLIDGMLGKILGVYI